MRYKCITFILIRNGKEWATHSSLSCRSLTYPGYGFCSKAGKLHDPHRSDGFVANFTHRNVVLTSRADAL